MSQRTRTAARAPVKKRRKLRRRRVRIAIVVTFAFLILSALSALTFTLVNSLLKVDKFIVTGKCIYTTDQIEQASGVTTGENMLALNTSAIAAKIEKELPFTDDVTVRRILPDKLKINVAYGAAAAVVSDSGKMFVINASGKVLEVLDGENTYPLPVVLRKEGKDIPQPGDMMQFADAIQQKIQVDILNLLSNNNILDIIQTIDLRDSSEMTMKMDGRLNVLLGNSSDLEEKIQFLTQIVAKLMPTDKGTIDVSDTKKASFLPDLSS